MICTVLTKIMHRKDYILVYQVHDNPNMDQYVRALQKKTGKQVIRLSNSFAHIIRIGKLVYLPSPKQFLSLIRIYKTIWA